MLKIGERFVQRYMSSFTRSSSSAQKTRTKRTPLVDILERRIRVTGPITVAEYMRECLINPQHVCTFTPSTPSLFKLVNLL